MLSRASTGSLFALLLLVGCLPSQHDYHGTYLDPPQPNEAFELQSIDGAVSSADLQGKWTALFFGYTHCPDVCPATMSILRQAIDKLDEAKQEQVQVAMISVDPERDTPERLASYVSAFNPSFIGLTGTTEQLDHLTSSIGIYHERTNETEDGRYDVDHTASVLLLDPEGGTRLIWSYGMSADAIADDLEHVLR